ncbi:unnamed protein product [Trichobilharzia regenti]|nr:unnamed protein product [Trichobilharzia regenti]
MPNILIPLHTQSSTLLRRRIHRNTRHNISRRQSKSVKKQLSELKTTQCSQTTISSDDNSSNNNNNKQDIEDQWKKRRQKRLIKSKQQFSSSTLPTSSHYQSHPRCSRYQNGYNSGNNNEHHSHQHTRPLSIALPIDNEERNETSLDSWYSSGQSHRRCQTEYSPRYKDFATSASADYSGPIYLNAALNAFGYGCRPEWKQFCVSPSARRLAHAKQSLRMRQMKRNSLDTELYTDISTGDIHESLNNTKHVLNNDQRKETISFYHENESGCKNGENSVESKPKQTIGYYCDVSTL